MPIKWANAAETTYQGILFPNYNGQLSIVSPGTVIEIAVKAGAHVKTGDLLIRLDTRAEDARIGTIDAEIANTVKMRTLQTQTEQAKLDMQRFQSSYAKNAATAMEVQHSKLQHSLSVLALEEENFRKELLVKTKEELIAQKESMCLYAEHDGIVEEIQVELGMAVDKNTPALRLVDIDPMIIELHIPVEKALGLVPGDKATVFINSNSSSLSEEEAIEGTVMQVASIAVLSNRTLKVRISAPNPNGRPVGLMATVSFPQLNP